MTDKELENITIKIPDNVPVSFLEKLTNFSQDVLMLASEPDERTETQYMSKYFTYGDLAKQLSIDFNLGFLSSEIERLQEEKVDKDSLHSNTLCCNVTSPYIISAITQDGGNITKLDGYRLQYGMYTVFNQSSVKSDLKTVIPSLTATTKTAGQGQVITSVVTENGQIKSIVAKDIKDLMDEGGASPASQAGGDAEKYIYSINTERGAITSFQSQPLTAVVTKTFYKAQAPSDSNPSSFSSTNLAPLYVMKLTRSQLDYMKSANRIQPTCLYMTTDE